MTTGLEVRIPYDNGNFEQPCAQNTGNFALLNKFSAYALHPSDKRSGKRYMLIAGDLRQSYEMHEEALDLLGEGTSNYPADFLLRFAYGKALFHEGHLGAAKDELRVARKLNPQDTATKTLLKRAVNISKIRWSRLTH